MKTKTLTIALLFILTSSLTAVSQNPERHNGPDFEKIKVEKIAFITEELSLTPAEAEKFWPTYNEFEKKKFEIMGQRHELEKKLKEEDLQKLSDAECVEISKKLASFFTADAKLTNEYNDKFLKILPPKKVVLLYLTEGKFRGNLLRNYRDKERKENN